MDCELSDQPPAPSGLRDLQIVPLGNKARANVIQIDPRFQHENRPVLCHGALLITDLLDVENEIAYRW